LNAENSQGANASITWLTDQAGTGKWEWYTRLVHCGDSGSFANGGHVYLSKTSSSASDAVTWYLSYCNCFDVTNGEYDGLRVRYADTCYGNAATATTASYLSAPDSSGAGFHTDAYGNFYHDRSTTTDCWHLNKNDGNRVLSVYWETGNVTAAGTVTATAFSGPLTGNVTGNCSGSSGSCTGNAATATRINGNLSTAGSGNHNIWVSDSEGANGIPRYVPSCYITGNGYLYATRVYNAVWNDYAEYR
jgi:hypothetical protein